MADENNKSPLKEAPFFPWLSTAAEIWLNLLNALPSNPDTSISTQITVQNRFLSSWIQI